MERKLYITKADYDDLLSLWKTIGFSNDSDAKYAAKLKAELDKAMIVDSNKIPPDVVTMNSKVCFVDMITKDEMTITIVFPRKADIKNNSVSVLAPIGIALIGYKAGDEIEFEIPGSGKRKIKIKKLIYQPERNKHNYL